MKNLTTIIVGLLLISLNLNAQNSCASALSITPGTHTVSDIFGGQVPPTTDCGPNFGAAWGARWFLYQASMEGLATVTSDLTGNSSIDTRLVIYNYPGDCGPPATLTCLAANDDIDGVDNQFSEVNFPVISGSSYYIVWDNTWYSPGDPIPPFQFSLTETAINCASVALPIVEDFDDFNSFTACLRTESADANLATFEIDTMRDYVENGSNSTVAKNDWLFSTPINLLTGHEYTISFKYNGADGNGDFANESLEVLFKDGATSTSNTLISLFSDPSIPSNGTLEQAESMATTQSIDYTSTATGTYFLAFNGTSPANTGSLLLFDYSVTDNTLEVSDFRLDGVTNFFDKVTDVLTIKSKIIALDNVEIYDILGQKVLTKKLSRTVERLNLSELYDGIYIIRISSSGLTTTSKLLKQ